MADKRNGEGYIDMTAYLAMTAVEKEEKKLMKGTRGKGGRRHAKTCDSIRKQLHRKEVNK